MKYEIATGIMMIFFTSGVFILATAEDRVGNSLGLALIAGALFLIATIAEKTC